MALTVAKERSTYIVTMTFTAEDGTTSMVPDTVKWSLRDNYGSIVNSRSAVSATAATVVTVVLSGADLVYEKNSLSLRTLIVEATYTSANGAGLPLNDQVSFEVSDITGV